MEWYVIIPSEVTQKHILSIITWNYWNYSYAVVEFVLVRTDSDSSQKIAGKATVLKCGSAKPLILKG
jgi:hypothetical protein